MFLGCGGERNAVYEKPQECLGLGDCKNIIENLVLSHIRSIK